MCVGVITGAHGIKGAVKLKSFTEFPSDMTAYGDLVTVDDTTANLSAVKEINQGLIANISLCEDRTQAEKLKGTYLYAPAENFPVAEEGQAYYRDLIGVTLVLADGTTLGEVVDVFDSGANDVLTVKSGAGTAMLPYTDDIVVELDKERNELVVTDFAKEFFNL